MRALSSRPFCSYETPRVSLEYLSAGCRYTAVWCRVRKNHATAAPVAASMRPGARRRRAHAVLLRTVGARWSGSRVVGRDNIPEAFPEICVIAQAVEHVALVPDAPGLVELAHRVVPALACPGHIVATHKAKHIPGKSGTDELGLEVAHDGSILGQCGLREVVRLRRVPRLRVCSVEVRL